MLLRDHESGTVHDIGATISQGGRATSPDPRIVLKVSVLNRDEISGGDGEALAEGRALATVDGLGKNSHALVDNVRHGGERAVRRTVIDDDHLAHEGLGQHPSHCGGDGLRLVERRHDNGKIFSADALLLATNEHVIERHITVVVGRSLIFSFV